MKELKPQRPPQSPEMKSNDNDISRVGIIGVNYIGNYVAKQPDRFFDKKDKVVGLVEFSATPAKNGGTSGIHTLGHLDELDHIIEEHNLQKVLIAMHRSDFPRLHEAIRICKRESIAYDILTEHYDLDGSSDWKKAIHSWFVLKEFSLRRMLDILFSALLFILVFPTWLFIIASIKLNSRGSAILSREMVGRDGRIFRMFTFRKFAYNSITRNRHFSQKDQKLPLTWIGRLIVKTNLYVLPQLINVFLGDMSLIGPAPESPYFSQKYEQEIPFYSNRLKVKPGIIGLAQVETAFDDSIETIRQKLKYDLYYVDHHKSFLVNAQILFKSLTGLITLRWR